MKIGEITIASACALLIAACGSTSDEAPAAAGSAPTRTDLPSSAAAPAATASSDGGGPAAPDAAALDPASCPVGPADGCCPAAQIYGGTDPDCPSLDCATFDKSAPIPLDAPAPSPSIEYGQAAMAWTGHELVLAWEDEGTTAPSVPSTLAIVQHRAPDGTLLGTDAPRVLDESNAPGFADTDVALGPSGELFFAFRSSTRSYRLARLNAPGTPAAWTKDLGASWEWFYGGSPQIIVHGADVFAGQQAYTCSAASCDGYPLLIALHGADGTTAGPLGNTGGNGSVNLAPGSAVYPTEAGGFVYQPSSAAIDVFSARDGSLFRTPVDLAKNAVAAPVTLRTATAPSERAFPATVSDGQRFAMFTRSTDASTTWAALTFWSPNGGATPAWRSSTVVKTGSSWSGNHSIIWTGAGYVVVSPGAVTKVANGAPHRADFSTAVLSFDAAGNLREAFALDAEPAAFPKLQWAGGRVAVTWVRPPAPGATTGGRHFLRWLSCP